MHNVSEADRLSSLDRVREHLLPNGRFAFNVFHPSLEYMPQHSGALTGVLLGRHLSTRVWRVRGPLRCESYDTVRQVVHSQHRDEECAADGVLRRTAIRIELAYLYPADIRRELARARLRT